MCSYKGLLHAFKSSVVPPYRCSLQSSSLLHVCIVVHRFRSIPLPTFSVLYYIVVRVSSGKIRPKDLEEIKIGQRMMHTAVWRLGSGSVVHVVRQQAETNTGADGRGRRKYKKTSLRA